MRRIIQPRIWCTAAAILIAAIPASAQESKGQWKLEKSAIRGFDISARSEIATPQGAGFATFRITCQPGVNPPVIVELIVESPKQLPLFPFEKYDGPVDKTSNEFIRLDVASGDQGRIRSLNLKVPNGGYNDGGFIFDTIEKSVVSFLLKVNDGQKLSVIVNGPPSSIHVSFDTTGLKQLLDQVGLKQSATKR